MLSGTRQVFDALEQIKGDKPRLLLVSAWDTRSLSKPPPAHYVRSLAPRTCTQLLRLTFVASPDCRRS